MNTTKPLSQRNINIIADRLAGMTSKQLAEKYGMTYGYVQKLASEYKRKDRLKVEDTHTANATGLYADRDTAILQAFTGMGMRVTAKHDMPQGKKKRGMTA